MGDLIADLNVTLGALAALLWNAVGIILAAGLGVALLIGLGRVLSNRKEKK